ncbi:MAG: ATP-binding protein [Candidatus Altiarchaeia archaeon]
MDRNTARSVLLAQKAEIEKKYQNRDYIQREAYVTGEQLLKSGLIIVVLGVRRCGKSTLCLQLLRDKKYAYVNFDDERFYGVSTGDLDTILELLYEVYGDFEHLLLDEAQNVPGWELFVNRLQRQGLKILVTGSNAKLLGKELATHLTGRHVSLELFPFSYAEFLQYRKTDQKERPQIAEDLGKSKNELKEYMEKGGFPEAYLFPDPARYLRDLYDSIVSKDIVGRHKIRNTNTLREIVTYMVSNYASPLTYKKIKNVFEIKSKHTIKNYAAYAEESYLVIQLPNFSYKIKEQIRMPRKTYAIDTGLIKAIGITSTENTGRLMENIAAIELMRRKGEAGTELYYWKDYAGNETDFITKKGTKVTEIIQVCHNLSDEKTKKREIKGLIAASKDLRCDELMIITWDEEGVEEHAGKKVKMVPMWKWLMEEM